MTAILSQNNYGKSNVRFLKVKRDGDIHFVNEFSVNVQLVGDFDEVHLKGDNSKVLPTDTMKNTVYAIAKDDPVNSPEEYGLNLAKYFLTNNKQVSKVTIDIEEKLWRRILSTKINSTELTPNNHSFESQGNERRTAEIILTHEKAEVISGLKDLLVLKTTQSSFTNFIRDKYTSLKDAEDRIFSTSVKAQWKYGVNNPDYQKSYNSVRQQIIDSFANYMSVSVQQTLFDTGRNVIENIKEVSEISLSMPNKHYLLFNLDQFGMENNNEIFIPTDEPYGLIEGIIKR